MLDVFLEGATVDLCVPTIAFARGDTWYRWFNSRTITRHLSDQGVFPNTPELQEEYFAGLEQSRLILVAQTKQGTPRGVVSFSHINWRRRNADFSIVFDHKIAPKTSPVAALEASALLLEHGVDTVGLHRIQASFHSQVARWAQRLELLGFRLEGIQRHGFVKGSESADALTSAASAGDIDAIRDFRGGKLFDCPEKMLERMRALPSVSMSEQLKGFSSRVCDPYYEKIFRL